MDEGLPVRDNDDEEEGEGDGRGLTVIGDGGNDSGDGGGGIDSQVEGDQPPKASTITESQLLPALPYLHRPTCSSPLLSISRSRQSSWFLGSNQHNQQSHHHSLSIPISFGAKN